MIVAARAVGADAARKARASTLIRGRPSGFKQQIDQTSADYSVREIATGSPMKSGQFKRMAIKRPVGSLAPSTMYSIFRAEIANMPGTGYDQTTCRLCRSSA